MPNYPTHSRWGRVGAVVMAVVVGVGLFLAFDSPVLAVAAAAGAAAATFVGAIFPDVDHHNSVPRRKAVRGMRILVWVGVVALAVLSWDLLVDVVDTAVVDPGQAAVTERLDSGVEIPPEFVTSVAVLLVAVALAGLVDPAIGFVTRSHRAWTHSVAVTFALTAAVAAAVWLFTGGLSLADGPALERRVAAVTVVGTFFVGVLIHLGLDGEIV